MEFGGEEAKILVSCSKGTYIRTLAEDIGKMLGCGAYLTSLRRVETGGFDLANAITIPQLEAMTLEQRDRALMPVDVLVGHLPSIHLDQDSAYYLLQGQAVWYSGQVEGGLLRLYDEQNRFLGLGQRDPEGRIAPKRLMKALA